MNKKELPEDAVIVFSGPAAAARVPGKIIPCFGCETPMAVSFATEKQIIKDHPVYFVMCFDCAPLYMKGQEAQFIPPNKEVQKLVQEAIGYQPDWGAMWKKIKGFMDEKPH